ncbi:cyclase family protein [Halomicrobium salinisoli]|uniref:cyclase family protein n=1 Tax=Halomicrobium salinisoli TaxID=2878391 RepID=UPI001CF066EE|nr:cyclase family protein [Halomicrobium salinisoli]
MPYRDLTRTVETDMPVFPGDPPVTVEPHATHEEDGYRVSAVTCGSHTGTHVDAPSHTEAEGRTIDAVDIDRFARDAVLADCRGRSPRSPIGPDALPATDADLVVVRTGWAEYWGEPEYFDHPYLTPEVAEFCVEQGYDVAIDALSVDPTPTDDADPEGVPAHHALLGQEHLIFENLSGLGDLPRRFEFLAFPLKLADGDGAPVRAVARFE